MDARERARQVRAAVPIYGPCASRMEFSSSSLIARPKPGTTATARGWFRLPGSAPSCTPWALVPATAFDGERL